MASIPNIITRMLHCRTEAVSKQAKTTVKRARHNDGQQYHALNLKYGLLLSIFILHDFPSKNKSTREI
jgi:hypothetical protein